MTRKIISYEALCIAHLFQGNNLFLLKLFVLKLTIFLVEEDGRKSADDF